MRTAHQNVPTPQLPREAAGKAYVDAAVAALQAYVDAAIASISGGGGDFGETIRVATAFGGNFATVNDWTPLGYTSTTKVIVIESQDGGTQAIGGLTGGVDGRVVTIMKVLTGGGGYPANIPYGQGLYFATESLGSTDVNRFAQNWANQSFGSRPSAFTARYDGGINRWIPLFCMVSGS